jgi:glycolate oxidase iron-sulfur subunit
MSSDGERAAELAALDCVHCGMCLEACPTYLLTGRETANPRGRLWLMQHFFESGELASGARAELDRCLVCRACETACPAGVRYGEVVGEVRARTRKRGRARTLLCDRVLIRRRTLHALFGLTRLAQRLGLLAIGRRLPGALGRLARACPEVPPAAARERMVGEHAATGEERGRVGFFEGCVMPELFGATNRATVALLQAAGYAVSVPEAQVCCGALHEHDGARDVAHALQRTNERAFDDPTLVAVIDNAAGCGAALKEAGASAPTLAARRQDATRFLRDHGQRLRFADASGEGPVTYDAPCHLHHAQGETDAPLALLRRVPGLDLVPLEEAELCCGAAGVYNLDQPALADELLERKLDHLAASGARVLLSGNPGCLLQWRRGVARRGLDVRVEHPLLFLHRHLAR